VGGFEGLRAAVPDSYFHMVKPISDPDFPWTGIFFGAPILGIWYWCTDQVIVQRVLSAKDEGHAKAGTIFAGFLKILPVFMLVFARANRCCSFPRSLQIRPQWPSAQWRHCLSHTHHQSASDRTCGPNDCALLAALMGAMSAVFNSASTLVTLDSIKNSSECD